MTQLKLTKAQAELKRLTSQVAVLLAEIERLNKALKWQQDETGRMGTHCPDCHLFGPRRYECLLARYKEEIEK